MTQSNVSIEEIKESLKKASSNGAFIATCVVSHSILASH